MSGVFARVAEAVGRHCKRVVRPESFHVHLLFEPIEERVLLSAELAPPPPDAAVVRTIQWATDAASALNATHSESAAVTSVSARSAFASRSSQELVFVDASVQDYRSLLAGLADRQGGGSRSFDVVVLDKGMDGVRQISEALAGRQGLSAIHILSHGASGALKLGGSTLSGSNLDAFSDAVRTWGKALKPGGDILLYGCNVAAGKTGIEFVNRLAGITGADVAASTDLTGGKGYGNWNLEYATGRIDVAQAFSTDAEFGYANALNYIVKGAAGGPNGTANAQDIFQFDVNGLLTATGAAITGPLDGLGGATGAPDVLDFSAYGGSLTFTIQPPAGAGLSSVMITDAAGNTVTANNFGKIIGGAGNDTYVFNPGWGKITIQDTTGTNNSDFTAVTNRLTSTTDLVAGTFTVSDALTGSSATLNSGFGLNLDLTAYKTQINQYLTQLQSFGGSLDAFGQFANALPGINQSLGVVLNAADMLKQFQNDISGYLNGAKPTSDGLVTALSGLAVNATPNGQGTIAGSYGTVTSVVNVTASGVELGFNFDYNVKRTANWAVDLGSNAALQGIKLPTVNVSVAATFDLNAMLGIQLKNATTPPVFLDVANLSGSASANATLNGFTVDFGFLTATASGGQFKLSAALQPAFKDPAGNGANRLSLSEVTNAVTTPSTLISALNSRGVGVNGVAGGATTAPSFSFSLPVTVTGVTGVTSGTITATKANVFSGTDPSISVTNGLTDFGNVSNADMLGMLRQLDDWLSQLSGTSILNQKVPMTQNTTLGDALNFGVAFKNDVVNKLILRDAQGNPILDAQGNEQLTFTSAQTLASQLSTLLGVTVAAKVVAATATTPRELRYRLDWSHSFANTTVPVNFQLDLGSLAGIQSTSSIPISATATLGFDFGIALTPSIALKVAPPNFVPNANVVPDNGKLTADATFNVTLFETTTTKDANGVVTGVTHATPVVKTVTVTKASTTNNQVLLPSGKPDTAASGNNLAADVQAALDAAFGTNKVKATYNGSRIVLEAVQPAATTAGGVTTTITRTIEAGAALKNTAYTEMGMPPATLTAGATFNVTVTTPSTGATATKTVTVTPTSTSTNQTIADLTADVQAALDMAFHNQLRGGAIALGLGPNASAVDYNVLMARAQTFQMQIQGVANPVQVTLAAAAGNGVPGTLKANLQTAVTNAVNAAIAAGNMPAGTAVTVNMNGDVITLLAKDATGRALTVDVLQPDVVASHQGGRIVLNATPTTKTTTSGNVTTTTNVPRTLEVSAAATDPAYTVLGLLNYPTPSTGVLSNDAVFNIKVNGTNHTVTVNKANTDGTAAGTTANQSIADLVADVNTALSTAGISTQVKAVQVTDSGGNPTNAIGFESIPGTGVNNLVVNVPQALTGGATNAAVSDLGYDPNADIVQKGRATDFFVDNAALSGNVTFDMSQIQGSAHFGFLGVDLNSTPGDAITGKAMLNLQDPTTKGKRVLLTTLANNLKSGTIGNVVTGSVTGNANVNLVLTPQTGFFTGANPQAKFSISLPANFDWLANKVINTGTPTAGQLKVSTNLTMIQGNLSDFTNFRQMGFADIVSTLNKAVDYLHQTEGTTAGGGKAGSALVGVLDTKIPVINQSATDLIGLADRFATVVAQLQSQQADSIQLADRLIKQALGLPLFKTGTTTPTAPIMRFDTSTATQTLRLDVPFTVAVNKTLPMDLDLLALGTAAGVSFPAKMKKFVGVSSTGDLNLGASASLNLTLGMEITGTGAGVSFTPFLYTGAGNTRLDLSITVNGSNLNFTAQAGPFGIHVINGSASASEGISFTMKDVTGTGRHHFSAGFTSNDFSVGAPVGTASASLPTFFPNASTPIGGVGNNLFTLDVKSVAGGLFNQVSFPKVPSFSSLKALTPLGMLNNPAILIDGLDMLLLTIQDSLNSQVLSTTLPFIGQALQPAAQFVSSFRTDLLAPLSLNLRAAGGTADQIVANTLFNVFGSAADGAVKQFGLGQLGYLRDITGDGIVNAGDIVRSGFGLTDTFGQFDFLIGNTYWLKVPTGFDLGIPGFNLSLDANVLLSIDWSIRFSFGVDQNKGFYFYTSNNKPVVQFNSLKGGNELLPGATPFANPNEINITATAQLVSNNYAGPSSGTGSLPAITSAATATGTLGFLKLKLTDGAGTPKTIANETTASNKTRVVAGFSVDVKDPNNDGFLTFAEMTAPSTSFASLLSTTKSGGAFLGLNTRVDFSGLNINPVPGISLASLLPSMSFDFAGTWDFANNFQIKKPGHLVGTKWVGGALTSLQFQNIQMDAGSLIKGFIGPFLDQIKFSIAPMDWLLGPTGMLNMRIPMISDLMGRTVNLNTLAGWFGTTNFQNLLNTIKNIYNLINMAAKLPSTGLGNIGFGTLDFSNIDFTNVKNLRSLIPSMSNPLVADETTMNPQANGFVASARGGGIQLDILKASNVFQLLLGAQDVSLITFQLPKASLAFNYLQRFPVFPPLFATLQGGFSASADLAIGYDTRGLAQFGISHNPNALINGFFFHDLNLTTGVDKPEAVLSGTIAAGAQIYGGIVSAGVAGGINAHVNFNFNDPNRDGKVRLGEMAANMRANGNNPLAIFDISGAVDWFFRAYAKVGVTLFGKFIGWQKSWNLGGGTIFNFNIGFARPGVAAQKVGNELWVNVGPNAADRIQGNVSDINERVRVGMGTGAHAGQYHVQVWNRDTNALMADSYLLNSGINKLVIDGGAGNDWIEVSGVTAPIEVHGGTGDDTITITGATAGLNTTTKKPQINIFGDDGNDTINLTGSSGATLIRGGKGDDTITGGAGADQIFGEDGNDQITGGLGDDQITGGLGNDTLAGGAGNDTYVFANNFGMDTVNDVGGLDTWDFTKVTTDINFTLKAAGGTKADVVTQQGAVTDSVSETVNLLAVENLLGGRGADTFDVFNVGVNNLTLNGQGGSDTYIMNAPLASAGGQVTLNDTGNLWDRDALVAKGTTGVDTFTVTDQAITIGASSVAFGTGGGIETMEVLGLGGNDVFNVYATPKSMSVTLDGGTGSDVFNIGTLNTGFVLNGGAGAMVFGLNGIQGDPQLTGNMVIKGGSAAQGAPAETDVLNVSDAFDTSANTGSMTDSTISGLGMQVGIDYATIETLNVLLGSNNDTLSVQSTIGGTTNVFGNNGMDVLDILNAAGTFLADGGAGNDTLTLRATALATTATLLGQAGNDQLNVLAVGGPTTVGGGAGNDVITVGSKAPLATGGVVNNIQGLVTVSGDTGTDVLNVDDSGDAANNTGTLTATTLTGLGMAQGINYGTVETLNLNLGGTSAGAGSSTVMDIRGTSALTNVVGGSGKTVFNVSSDAPANLGVLDQVQGVLNITANGQDTLNISDFGRTGSDTVTISKSTVTGSSHAAINYFEAGGRFAGGININTGQGPDTVTVTGTLPGDVTSLWTNAGNDVVMATSPGPDGLLVTFGGAGSDVINASAWATGIVAFGDSGAITYSGPVHNPFTIVTVRSVQPEVGSADTLIGSAGNDYLFGGIGNEVIAGGSGKDVLIGDSGEITFTNGMMTRVGTSAFFTGGADILKGGPGNDFIFGGAGHDLLYGNLGEDVMFGDNGRVTLENGQVVTLVMLGQVPLDVIASTMFRLYDSPYARVGVSGGQTTIVSDAVPQVEGGNGQRLSLLTGAMGTGHEHGVRHDLGENVYLATLPHEMYVWPRSLSKAVVQSPQELVSAETMREVRLLQTEETEGFAISGDASIAFRDRGIDATVSKKTGVESSSSAKSGTMMALAAISGWRVLRHDGKRKAKCWRFDFSPKLSDSHRMQRKVERKIRVDWNG